MRMHITYVSKEDFFLAFYNAFYTAITKSNIWGGFRGLGLVPYNPDYIILLLGLGVNALINATEATIYKKVQLPFESRAHASLI